MIDFSGVFGFVY